MQTEAKYIKRKTKIVLTSLVLFLLSGAVSCKLTPPLVSINKPPDKSTFAMGATIQFEVYVDSTISNTDLLDFRCTSSIDGEIFNGYFDDAVLHETVTFTKSDLSEGTHIIHCYARDRIYLTGHDSISIFVSEQEEEDDDDDEEEGDNGNLSATECDATACITVDAYEEPSYQYGCQCFVNVPYTNSCSEDVWVLTKRERNTDSYWSRSSAFPPGKETTAQSTKNCCDAADECSWTYYTEIAAIVTDEGCLWIEDDPENSGISIQTLEENPCADYMPSN